MTKNTHTQDANNEWNYSVDKFYLPYGVSFSHKTQHVKYVSYVYDELELKYV